MSGLRSVGKVLLAVSLLSSVSLLAFGQEDVATMTTVELIDEALRLLDEREKRSEKREASLEQRASNLNTIENSLLRIEQVASDFENYSKSLEDDNASLETWNNILIGTTAIATVIAIAAFTLR